MNYRILFILLLTKACQDVTAQDHLEPTNDIFSEYQFMYEYHSKVRDILMKELAGMPIAQLIIIPSFSKEIIWQIQHDEEADRYYSVTSTGNHSIWYNEYEDKPKNIKAEISSTEISAETGKLVKKLFLVAISTVRYSPSNDGCGWN